VGSVSGSYRQRQEKLLDLLDAPRTMEEIVNGRPREPRELCAFAEQATMQKHLNDLLTDSMVAEEDGRYYRVVK